MNDQPGAEASVPAVRATHWRVAYSALVVLIAMTSLFGTSWLGTLRTALGDGIAAPALGTVAALLLAGGCAPLLRQPDGVAVLRIGAAAAALSLLLALLPAGPRWMHPVLFGPLGFCAARGFGARNGLALVLACAALDEGLQHLLPDRTGSPNDVAANALSGGAGILLGAERSRNPRAQGR